jgi:Plasmid pRiA4b ORF-3-like protein
MIGLVETSAGTSLYQLKITLSDSKPPIWRRVIVPANIPLHRLHKVIQTIMGWTDSHLHQFCVGSKCYGEPDSDSDFEPLDERCYTLLDLAPKSGRKLIYEYDFGDDWKHEVVVEKVLPADPSFKHPICLAGEYACPPEDCGGIGGYYEFVTALAYPDHEEHVDMKNWIGRRWDVKHFDLEGTNARLKKLKG